MPTKTECNKHLCDSKIYSESELKRGLLAMKKLITSEGIIKFEEDERFKMLTQCKTNVDEVFDEKQCAVLNKPKPFYRRPQPPQQQSRRKEKKAKDPKEETEKRRKAQEAYNKAWAEKKAKKEEKAHEKEQEKKRKAFEKEEDKKRKAFEKEQDKKQKAFEKEQKEQEKKQNKTLSLSSKKKSAKKRCPNGTRRNKKTGECDPKK
jgi:hypothetical protein